MTQPPSEDWRLKWGPLATPLFRAWWRIARPMTLGVRGIARDAEGRVLLVRHSYAKGWHLPGGGVEHGEDAATAIAREMAEEAGIEAVEAPILAGFFANHANFPNDHIALYRIDAWRPCAPKENGEIAERGFFSAADLPDEVTPGTRRRILELAEGRQPPAIW